MYVKRLKIANFRNFSQVEIDLSPEANILYGRNGAGKTNLLEALFVLCLGRSQRGSPESAMLRENEEVYRIEGCIEEGGIAHEVALAYPRGGRKKITIDRVPVRVAELYENYSAVSAGPEDSAILSGSPSVRRNFLDMYLSQFSKKYLTHLVEYQRALAQKNACLKSAADPAPFDVILVNVGAEIIKARSAFIEKMYQAAGRYYAEISRTGRFSLSYSPSVPLSRGVESTDEISSCFQAALKQNEERERVMKTALVGPHRDDILFQIGDYPARSHGSQGEWRTAAIALKLAVYHLLKAKRKTQPVLLLDEIFAELDDQRSAGLMQALGDFGQLFLTTAADPPKSLRQQSRCFRIHQGVVQEIGY